MKLKLLSFGMVLAGMTLAGCNKPAETPKADDKKTEKAAKKNGDHGDHGEGPHGGTVIELGKHHGEFVVDHAKKSATVYILDGNVKNAEPISAAKLSLSIKQPQFQVDLLAVPQDGDPKGKSSRFVATHDNFGKEQKFEGTVSVEIESKPYLGDFKEEEHKHEKGGKDNK